MLKEITFIIGTEKPNGNIVQDDLFKVYRPVITYFEQTFMQKSHGNTGGYTHNASTGVVDFTALGGVANGILNFYCSKICD